jgi:hypothetical protein
MEIVTTREAIKKVFEKWYQDYISNPEEYKPMSNNPSFDAEDATNHFLSLLDDGND